MDYVTRHEGYEYVSMVMATTFLVPQVYKCYYSQSAGDLSSGTLGMILTSSVLWAMYVYETPEMDVFTAPTLFVATNALCLLGMKVWYSRPNHAPAQSAAAHAPTRHPSRKEEEDETPAEDNADEQTPTDYNKLFCRAGMALGSVAAMAV